MATNRPTLQLGNPPPSLSLQLTGCVIVASDWAMLGLGSNDQSNPPYRTAL